MNFKEYKVTVHDNGDVYWSINDKFHREGAPAVERADGSKQYWINGKLHREDGPAFEFADGSKEYWINGKKISKADFLKRTKGKGETMATAKKKSSKKITTTRRYQHSRSSLTDRMLKIISAAKRIDTLFMSPNEVDGELNSLVDQLDELILLLEDKPR